MSRQAKNAQPPSFQCRPEVQSQPPAAVLLRALQQILMPVAMEQQPASAWLKAWSLEVAESVKSHQANRWVAIAHLYQMKPTLEDLQIVERHLEIWSGQVGPVGFRKFSSNLVRRLLSVMTQVFYEFGPADARIAILYRLLIEMRDASAEHHAMYLGHLILRERWDDAEEFAARFQEAYSGDDHFVMWFQLLAKGRMKLAAPPSLRDLSSSATSTDAPNTCKESQDGE